MRLPAEPMGPRAMQTNLKSKEKGIIPKISNIVFIIASYNMYRRSIQSFLAERNGATAIEFAIISIPFMALVGSCLESGFNYYGQEILEQAVTEAGRKIYTGQFQMANAGITDTTMLLDNFRNVLCLTNGQPRITTFSCKDVKISISKAASFNAATPVQPTITDPKTGTSDWNPSFPSYSCARGSDIVVIQVAIDVPVYFSFLGSNSEKLPNRRRIIQAATVFQVEPYDSNAVCPLGS